MLFQERVVRTKLDIYVFIKSDPFVRKYQTCLLLCDYAISHPASHIFVLLIPCKPTGVALSCLIFTSVITLSVIILSVKDTIYRGLRQTQVCHSLEKAETGFRHTTVYVVACDN